MEINKFNFLLTKEIQINFSMCDLALSNCHICNNCTHKGTVIEKTKFLNNLNQITKRDMMCVGRCECFCKSFMAKPDQGVSE